MHGRLTERLAVARALREIALLLGAKRDSRFRVLAYERGAVALEGLRGDFDTLVREGRLQETPGIGPGLAAEIGTLCRSGTSPLLERLRRELPPGILELRRVPGLSTLRIGRLHEALGIASVEELRQACEQGRVRTVRGFGPIAERRLLEAICSLGAPQRLLLLHEAFAEAEPLLDHLRETPKVERAELAGPLRRGAESVPSIEIVAASISPAAVGRALAHWPRTAQLVERSSSRCQIELASAARVEVQIAPPPSFVSAWHRATGSQSHVEKLLMLPPGQVSQSGDERAIYEARGLPWIPPELREDEGEIEAALVGGLPDDLVQAGDLRGFVHCHTSHSDGRASIEQMARAAEARGAEYLTITDHSPAAFYANGLDRERLQRQWDEIDRVQQRLSIRILRGTESDILEDGALDYPDEVLERMDLVIASIHARHRMDARRMTERIVRAMRQPVFKVWGHGLGRLIGRRPPLECDIEAVLDAVAVSRAAIEVNGDPHRLDLEPRWLRAARARGIRFVISTDAHSTSELGNVRYGVTTARRGWLRRRDVLNTLPLQEFLAAVRPARAAA